MKLKGKLILALLVVVSFAALYFCGLKTYTYYESEVDENMDVAIAKWNIFIDGQNITSATRNMGVSNITWNADHTRDGKVAPGSIGVVNVEIVPQTDVSIEYDISYIDHTMDPNIVLTVTSISLSGVDYERVGNSFRGMIPIEQINQGKTMYLTIGVEWINDEANNEADSNIFLNGGTANYLSLTLDAKQYMGE